MRELAREAYRFLKHDVIYGTLLYRYGVRRHRTLRATATRRDDHAYTCFYRSPDQLDALVGPVMRHLHADRRAPVRIHVFACSIGAEPYTVASVLARAFPALAFEITASDVHADMVERTRAASYSATEVHRRRPPARFVDDTFERCGAGYRVRAELRRRVTAVRASVLDAKLASRFAPIDIAFAQNVFCHLSLDEARDAFRHVHGLLADRSAMFVDGMDLDQREQLTAELGLVPLDYKVREIHEHARTHVADRWWNYYYGIEPYAPWHPDRLRRFGTIFLGRSAMTGPVRACR